MSKKVLVIDDDVAILEVIKIILEEKKYQVTTASNITTVQLLSETDIPDIILLDIWISGTNGRTIAQYIKNQKLLAHIPIIFVSAHNDAEKIAKEAGAQGHLSKPFDIDELFSVIEKHTS